MNHLFIINPFAGNGSYKNFEKTLQELKARRKDVYIEKTEYKGHCEKILINYKNKGIHRVYSLGGDGTSNELLNAIMKLNLSDQLSMGIIPCGSGNDYIKNFNIGQHIYEPKTYIENLMNAKPIKIDIGRMNQDYFINIVSVGFDAEVIKNSYLFKKNLLIPNKWVYLLSALYTLLKMETYECRISTDNGHVFDRFMMASMGNGKYYGNGMKVLPDAKISDGYFDICMVSSLSKIRFLSLIKTFIKGNHKGIKQVTILKAKKIEIISLNRIPFQYDGELQEGNQWSIEIIPQAIDLLIPFQ